MFKDVIGQNSAVKILKAAINNNKCASSYLFVGTEGIGKKLAALSFAQILNCGDVYDLDACAKCVSCRKTIQGNHPDVQVIVPQKTSISIDQIRSVQKDSFLKPLEGRRKIYIIDNAEMMTLEAMNCFLKLLEEPSSQVLFVLITSNLAGLLETIISRCQVIRFNNLSKDNIRFFLEEKHGVDREKAYMLASLSCGSIGLALNYSDYDVVESTKNMVKLLDDIKNENISVLFKTAEELARNKDDIQIMLNLLLSIYRDMLISVIAAEAQNNSLKDNLLSNVSLYNLLSEKSGLYSINELKYSLNVILDTKILIKKNVNTQLAIETMFLKLTENQRTQCV